LIRPTTIRFKNSNRVFAHSFDDAAGWKTSDRSSIGIEKESESVAVPPRNISILRRSKNLHSRRSVGRKRLGPIQTTLLAAGSLAFLCVILVILVQNIHPAPDKLTLQKDAAELASMETQSRKEDRQIEARTSPSAAASSIETDLIVAQPEEHSQSQAPESRLIASNINPLAPITDAGSSEAKARLRAFKRDHARHPQRPRAVAPTQQPNKQQGLSLFFAHIGRALGFSTN
jgi:hypothetical protein